MANDAVAAVVQLLVGAGLAGGRVFGGSLPQEENEHMPRAAVVVRDAGGAGTFGGGYLPTVDDRVDVRCYAASEYAAKQLSVAVSLVLHRARDFTTGHGRVLWARRAGGPVAVRETQTGWELNLTSWQVYGTWLDDDEE